MKKLKIILIFLLLVIFIRCEKTEDLYTPGIVCTSDWLTNMSYHLPVVPSDIAALQPSFTISVDGLPWTANTIYATKGSDGKRNINILGSHLFFYISFYGSRADTARITLDPYYASSNKIIEKKIGHCSYNEQTGVLNMDFSLKVVQHYTYPSDYTDTIEYTAGKIRDTRVHDFYERTEYKLSTADSVLHGEWRLIEITDCASGELLYPPYVWPFYMEFDTTGFKYDPDPQYYPYKYPAHIYGRNSHSLSFEFINDTTIVTSGDGSTQAGMAKEDADYYYMLCDLVDWTTLTLKMNKNLLELKTKDNIYLRFFK